MPAIRTPSTRGRCKIEKLKKLAPTFSWTLQFRSVAQKAFNSHSVSLHYTINTTESSSCNSCDKKANAAIIIRQSDRARHPCYVALEELDENIALVRHKQNYLAGVLSNLPSFGQFEKRRLFVKFERGGSGTGWLTRPIPNIIGFLLSDQDLEDQCWSAHQIGRPTSSAADLSSTCQLTQGFAPRLLLG